MASSREDGSSGAPRGRGIRRYSTTLRIRRPFDEVFDFFSDVRKLEFIRPPGLDVRVLADGGVAMFDGALIDYKVRLHGVSFSWRSRILNWRPPVGFVDEQVSGPFSVWYHRHTFAVEGDWVTMVDEVFYRLPLWPLGECAAPCVNREIERIFAFRTRKIIETFGRDSVIALDRSA